MSLLQQQGRHGGKTNFLKVLVASVGLLPGLSTHKTAQWRCAASMEASNESGCPQEVRTDLADSVAKRQLLDARMDKERAFLL